MSSSSDAAQTATQKAAGNPLKTLPDSSSTTLPRDLALLEAELKDLGLEGASIHDGYELYSASTSSQKLPQVFLLRVCSERIEDVKDLEDPLLTQFVTPRSLNKAKGPLDKSEPFQHYLVSLGQSRRELVENGWYEMGQYRGLRDNGLTICDDISMLTQSQEKLYASLEDSSSKVDHVEDLLPRLSSAKISDDQPEDSVPEAASKPVSTPQDEQPINAFLYYNCVIVTNDDKRLPFHFSMARLPFIFSSVDRRKKLFEARTDGYGKWCLKRDGDGALLCIMETKRHDIEPSAALRKNLTCQLACQLAAWISAWPPMSWEKAPGKKERWLRCIVCQCNRAQYFVFCTFDDDYVDYLRSNKKGKEGKYGHATMHPLGPFFIDQKDDAEKAACIMNGYSHQLDEARRAAKGEEPLPL